MVEIGKDITLANGKGYSPENLDLDVLMNAKNIMRGYRFTGVPPQDNFSLQDHSMECYTIGARWWDYKEEKGNNDILQVFPKSFIEKWGRGGKQLAKSYFCQQCLIHDWNELVTGDLVPTFKTEIFREKEEIVQKEIKRFLGFEDRPDPKNILKNNVKIVDITSSMWEVKKLMTRYPAVGRIYEVRKELLGKYIPYVKISPFLEQIGVI